MEDGRNAEITVDLVLLARATLSDKKVNGLEDAIVSEMIKKLLSEKIYTIARCFHERSMALMESPSSWKIVKLVFFRKPDAAPKKGIRNNRAIALTSVMSKWYASCILLCLEKDKELKTGRTDILRRVDGISCQIYFKTLGMARRKESRDETWCSGGTDNVHGELRHQDGLR